MTKTYPPPASQAVGIPLKKTMKPHAPDLRIRTPRSPRVPLAGYTILPRIIDKARAQAANTAGEYQYDSPLDSVFFAFTGIDPDALYQAILTVPNDWEVAQWVRDHATSQSTPVEIETWAAWTARYSLTSPDDRDWYSDQIRRLNPKRRDLRFSFDYLDLDDYVSFGGAA